MFELSLTSWRNWIEHTSVKIESSRWKANWIRRSICSTKNLSTWVSTNRPPNSNLNSIEQKGESRVTISPRTNAWFHSRVYSVIRRLFEQVSQTYANEERSLGCSWSRLLEKERFRIVRKMFREFSWIRWFKHWNSKKLVNGDQTIENNWWGEEKGELQEKYWTCYQSCF